MTRLLVSVRSAAEARLALAAGVDLIDVKEPSLGSLGAAVYDVVREVLRTVAGRVPISLACGELLEFTAFHAALGCRGYQYAKLGLSGCADVDGWPQRWQAAWAEFPAGVTPVAVAYADYEAARSPPPAVVLEQGLHCGCRVLLIDTFEKQGGGLLDRLGLSELEQLFSTARRYELTTVIAGSLMPATISQVLPLEPDYVAVRGAACEGARYTSLDPRRTAELVALVRGSFKRPEPA